MKKYKWSHPAEWLGEKLQEKAAVAVDVDNLAREIAYSLGRPIAQGLNKALNPVFDAMRELFDYANALKGALDSDALQDLFQSEMDADGYFTPIASDPIVEFDSDEAEYIGDETNGVYYQVAEGPDGWYMTAVVETTHSMDTLVKDDGPYLNREQAEAAGKDAAIAWCMDNRVSWEDEE